MFLVVRTTNEIIKISRKDYIYLVSLKRVGGEYYISFFAIEQLPSFPAVSFCNTDLFCKVLNANF